MASYLQSQTTCSPQYFLGGLASLLAPGPSGLRRQFCKNSIDVPHRAYPCCLRDTNRFFVIFYLYPDTCGPKQDMVKGRKMAAALRQLAVIIYIFP